MGLRQSVFGGGSSIRSTTPRHSAMLDLPPMCQCGDHVEASLLARIQLLAAFRSFRLPAIALLAAMLYSSSICSLYAPQQGREDHRQLYPTMQVRFHSASRTAPLPSPERDSQCAIHGFREAARRSVVRASGLNEMVSRQASARSIAQRVRWKKEIRSRLADRGALWTSLYSDDGAGGSNADARVKPPGPRESPGTAAPERPQRALHHCCHQRPALLP